MVLLEHQGKVGYNLDKKEHPLDVELGYAHFARNGEKDFLRKVPVMRSGRTAFYWRRTLIMREAPW